MLDGGLGVSSAQRRIYWRASECCLSRKEARCRGTTGRSRYFVCWGSCAVLVLAGALADDSKLIPVRGEKMECHFFVDLTDRIC